MMPQAFYITHRLEERPDTITLQLAAAKGQQPAAFLPGQFNMLYAFGGGEVAISHSGPVRNDGTYHHTIKVVGPVTAALAKLREGDSLGVRGPFGRGWPLDQVAGRPVMIIAGGLGLAPLRPLIYSLLSKHSTAPGRATKRIELYYGAKHPDQILYQDEIAQWSKQIDTQITVDRADTHWRGHVGNVNSLLMSLSSVPDNTVCFICGPEVMIHFAIRVLIDKGLPAEAIYLSMERNMQCATGHCGHCQWGPHFVCKDGPVFCYRDIQDWFGIREL